MSTQPIDMTQFGAADVLRKWIAELTAIAAAHNQSVVDTYEKQLDAFHADVAWKSAVNSSQMMTGKTPLATLPMPVAPELWMVNETYVAYGQQTPRPADFDPLKQFNYVTYTHVDPPPPSPPQIVIGDAIPGMPGFFSLKPGPDGHAPSVAGLPDGFPIDQDGHRYLKRTVGFAGSGAMFQQVS